AVSGTPIVSTVSAAFTFTVPTPSGTTTASGVLTALKTQGGQPVRTVTYDWSPSIFTFTNGVKLLVDIHDFSYQCVSSCTNDDPFHMSGFFQLLQGPQDEIPPGTPLPAAAWLFGTVLAGGAGVSRWRKHKARKVAA